MVCIVIFILVNLYDSVLLMQDMDVDVPATSEAAPVPQPEQTNAAGDASAAPAGKEGETAKEAASEPSAMDKTAEFFNNLPRYACALKHALARDLPHMLCTCASMHCGGDCRDEQKRRSAKIYQCRHGGALSDEDHERAAKVAMALLRHIHAWGPTYKPLSAEEYSALGERAQLAALKRPDAASTAQAVLLLLSRLTKRHNIALKVQVPSVIADAVLCWQSNLACFLCSISVNDEAASLFSSVMPSKHLARLDCTYHHIHFIILQPKRESKVVSRSTACVPALKD